VEAVGGQRLADHLLHVFTWAIGVRIDRVQCGGDLCCTLVASPAVRTAISAHGQGLCANGTWISGNSPSLGPAFRTVAVDPYDLPLGGRPSRVACQTPPVDGVPSGRFPYSAFRLEIEGVVDLRLREHHTRSGDDARVSVRRADVSQRQSCPSPLEDHAVRVFNYGREPS
jgi:hypothetical protein